MSNSMKNYCRVGIVMWPASLAKSLFLTIYKYNDSPVASRFRISVQRMRHPGIFCRWFYEYCVFGHTTHLKYCFLHTIQNGRSCIQTLIGYQPTNGLLCCLCTWDKRKYYFHWNLFTNRIVNMCICGLRKIRRWAFERECCMRIQLCCIYVC